MWKEISGLNRDSRTAASCAPAAASADENSQLDCSSIARRARAGVFIVLLDETRRNAGQKRCAFARASVTGDFPAMPHTCESVPTANRKNLPVGQPSGICLAWE